MAARKQKAAEAEEKAGRREQCGGRRAGNDGRRKNGGHVCAGRVSVEESYDGRAKVWALCSGGEVAVCCSGAGTWRSVSAVHRNEAEGTSNR